MLGQGQENLGAPCCKLQWGAVRDSDQDEGESFASSFASHLGSHITCMQLFDEETFQRETFRLGRREYPYYYEVMSERHARG